MKQRISNRLQSLAMAVAFACAAVLLPAVAARAQVAQPPDATVAASDALTPAQNEQIQTFVAARAAGLAGDATEIKRTRDDILRPLQGSRVSVAFRLEYAKQIAPALEKAVASGNEQQVVNGLRIAGELAAPRSMALLTKSLTDPRAAVRYGAAFGIARFLDASGRTGPAASPDQLADLIKALATQAKVEKDALVFDGLVLGLAAAVKVPEASVKGLRVPGLAALAKAGEDRAKALSAAPTDGAALRTVESLFRICGVARTALTDIQQAALPPEARAGCVAMAAATVAACADVEKAGPTSGVSPGALGQLRAAAEAVQKFAKS